MASELSQLIEDELKKVEGGASRDEHQKRLSSLRVKTARPGGSNQPSGVVSRLHGWWQHFSSNRRQLAFAGIVVGTLLLMVVIAAAKSKGQVSSPAGFSRSTMVSPSPAGASANALPTSSNDEALSALGKDSSSSQMSTADINPTVIAAGRNGTAAGTLPEAGRIADKAAAAAAKNGNTEDDSEISMLVARHDEVMQGVARKNEEGETDENGSSSLPDNISLDEAEGFEAIDEEVDGLDEQEETDMDFTDAEMLADENNTGLR